MSIVKVCCCCFVSNKESEIHICPSINPSGHRFLYQSLPGDYGSSGEPFTSSIPLSTQPRHRFINRQRSSTSTADSQHSVHRYSKKGYTVVEDGDCPKLECIIIPSFGKCPPHVVAIKKASSDFLKGVGNDLEKIQTMIGDDSDKELSRVEHMCHFKQTKIKEFETKIRSRMENIKLSRNHASANQKGLLIWYTGHGEKDTGNWVFEDACLKFEDVYNLYKTYFRGHYLYIVADCCYSGAWVVECARLLDGDGINCGHAAKRERIYIKVFAACLPKELANDKFYIECQGARLHTHDDHHKTIVFAQHQKLQVKYPHKITGQQTISQTAIGMDFTQNNDCILQGETCTCGSTWERRVKCLCEENYTHTYLV